MMTDFVINLKDQIDDVADYRWVLDDKFFSDVQGPEIQRGHVEATLQVRRLISGYELTFRFEGSLALLCDRCLEPMNQLVEGESTLRVKLGETLEDDGDIVTIPEEDGTIDVAWHLYEAIALQIPLRHVHPDGECQGKVGEALGKYMSREEEEEEKPSDPRWDALKKILDNN